MGGAVWSEEECSVWDACVSPSQVFQVLGSLFAPLMSTLGLNSKAAEVVSILLSHYDAFFSRIPDTSLLIDWTDVLSKSAL